MTSEQKVKQVYPKAYWSDHRICSPLENGLPFKVEIYLSSRLTVPRGTKSSQERYWADAWRRIAAARADEKVGLE
jgi:hypothetical protein